MFTLTNKTVSAFAGGHHARVLNLGADARHAVGLMTGEKTLADLCRQRDGDLLVNQAVASAVMSRSILADAVCSATRLDLDIRWQ